ncbi:MAG: Stk1 family PASTA domain-containing Ser/Thr kinase [Clostridia bacterium]|nr:Stk1 family PASTA domain-containing Ser/Thr kinase [Clostridia bacterium]
MGSKVLAGRYELLEKKGDGGMAVVYKAKDRLLNRFVAIKILRPEYIRDPKFIDSFRRESQAAAGLSHPNIVSVYDVGKEGNIYYIVMELLDGRDLSDVIRREAPLPEKKAMDITRKIASALSLAHKKNLIHRDVKPHNILITEDGTVKITDFGIARAVNSSTIVNGTSTVMGSVHYLSPEQARGDNVDARSDLYSLGIVMYEMLTGRVPFDGENAVSVAMMHMNQDVPAPSLSNPGLSSVMDAVVLKLTRRDPGQRFQTADEVIRALDSVSSAAAGDVSVNSFEDLDRGYESVPDEGAAEEEGLLARAMRMKASAKPKKRLSPEEKKKNKRTIILAVIAALICAIPVSIMLLNLFSGVGGKTVKVPDVVNMTQEEAESALEDAGLKFRLGTPVESEDIESGKVVSTNPAAGKEVKEGYEVVLILSKGADDAKVSVPTVTGMSQSEAEKILKQFDLTVGSVTTQENEAEKGTVVSQDPGSGSEVASGTAINLVISGGMTQVEVPNIKSMSRSEAKNALEKAGLTLGEVSEDESDEDEGKIISQSPDAGSKVNSGSAVNAVISKGKSGSSQSQSVDVPLGIDYSAANNEVFALTVTVTDSNGLHYVVNNQQRVRSDGGETVTLTGIGKGTVRVIFDDQIVKEYSVNFENGSLG